MEDVAMGTTQPAEQHHRFSVMWMNIPHAPWNRTMSQHSFPIRDLLPLARDHPLETWDVYLDQVHLILNPPNIVNAAINDLTLPALASGDALNLDFRSETYQLMVRFEPNGERNVLYTEAALDPNRTDRVASMIVPLVYSSSLFLTPSVDSGDQYNRVYRPIRDLPIAQNLSASFNSGPLTVELLWPILVANSPGILQAIPNYRILRVICDFSCRRRR
jgi:hypothetical protein